MYRESSGVWRQRRGRRGLAGLLVRQPVVEDAQLLGEQQHQLVHLLLVPLGRRHAQRVPARLGDDALLLVERALPALRLLEMGAGRAAWFLVILTGPQGAPPALGTKIVTTQAIPTTLCIF